MNLYLIRHTAVEVPQGFCYGQLDVPLKSSFEDEALKVMAALEGLSFDAIYTSPLSRCSKLATFCGYANPILDARLMELNFGLWEGKLWEEITGAYAEHWFNNWLTVKTPEGESFMDLTQRLQDFLEQLPKDYENIALFTHGGGINALRVLLEGLDPLQAFSQTPIYGAVLSLVFYP